MTLIFNPQQAVVMTHIPARKQGHSKDRGSVIIRCPFSPALIEDQGQTDHATILADPDPQPRPMTLTFNRRQAMVMTQEIKITQRSEVQSLFGVRVRPD